MSHPGLGESATEFWQGVAQFNRGDYYACHDTLEALWMVALEPERTFFQGILQLAVACYHLQQNNQRGAVLLLGEGLRRLNSYLPSYADVDLAQLCNQAQALLLSLQTQAQELAPTPSTLQITRVEY